MEHEAFVVKTAGGNPQWGVRGFTHAALLVWPTRGVIYVAGAGLIGLAPMLGFAAFAVWRGDHTLLVWILPAALAFYAGRPHLNLIGGIPWFACVVAGLAASAWFGALHAFGGLLPSATWIVSGALRGTVMQMMEARLRASKDAYDRLKASGRLLLPEPGPRTGPDDPQ